MKFADKILKLRKSRGMSQEELAEKLNVSRQAISRWEMDTAQPDVQNVLNMSKLFGVTADYLLNDDYDSDQEIPCVKEVRSQLDEKNEKNVKLLLIGGFSWLLAAFCFLTAGLCSLAERNYGLYIVFSVISLIDIILSVTYFLKYRKSKGQ